MAIADLNVIGFETGDTLRCQSTSGTFSIQTTRVRTGTYAARFALTAQTGYIQLGGMAATGLNSTLGALATVHATMYLYIDSLNATDREIAYFANASGGSNRCMELFLGSAGTVYLTGATTSSTVAISTGAWHRIDMIAVQNTNTCSLAVDGGTPVTCTGRNFSTNYFLIGSPGGSATMDITFDDIVLGTTACGDVAVKRMAPDGIGSQTSGFTGGTATGGDYVHVDEVPHDTDTTYWGASGSTTARRTVTLASSATSGISGTVRAVVGVAITRDEGGSSGWGVTMRNNTTNSDKTTGDFGATYIALSHLRTTDPNGGGAWSTGGLDTLEVGVIADDITAMRCTMLMAEVAYTPPAGTTATPDLLALTTATFAPTVTVSNNQLVTPGVLALLTSLFAPVIALPQLVTPDKLALTTATFAPTVTASDKQLATPGALAMTLSPFAPVVTVSGNQLVTPDLLALVTQTYAPTVTAPDPQTVTPGVLAMTTTGLAPTVTATINQLVTPATLALTIVLFAPDVTGDVMVFGPFPLAGSARGGVTIGGTVTGGIRLRGTARREDT